MEGMDTARSWEARAMFQAPVELADRSFRTKSIDAGDDFTLEAIRLGLKGQIIFKFKPIEPKEYEFVELDETKVAVFDGFIEAAITALGCVPGPKLAGAPGRAVSWEEAKQSWRRKRRRQLEDEAEAVKKSAEEKKKAEVRSKLQSYEDDPIFGSW